MPTLWLLRHAKAANFIPGRGDAERPLTERGRTQADTIGRLLARQEPIEHVLCSTATRTRETLEGLGLDAPVEFCEDIYQTGSDAIAHLIGEVDPAVQTLLVVGHAPGVPALAQDLAREGSDPDAMARLEAGYPTATLTRVDVDSWDRLQDTRVTHVHLAG